MSIATEITRLNTAKESLKTSIGNLGGDVSGTIDTYAASLNSQFGAFVARTISGAVVVPEGPIQLGESIFRSCSRMTEITLPSTLYQMSGANEFYGCTAMTKCTFLGALRNIHTNAFYGCRALVTLDLSNCDRVPRFGTTSSTTVGTTSHINTTALQYIIVPDSLYDEWIASTYWANFTSYIIKKSDYDAL